MNHAETGVIFRFVIVTARDASDEVAFTRLLRVSGPDDLERGLSETVAEWRQFYPERDLLKEHCTLLIEEAKDGPLAGPTN
jgi:hypothetical protein